MSNLTLSPFAKIGMQGSTGTGKSFTTLMLALGIAIERCNNAPVYVWDSEPQWHFYRDIFATEKVRLIHDPNRSFKSLANSLSIARREGAGVHITDQIATPWRDLLDSFSDDSGFIGMHRQNQLRGHWDDFVAEWKDMPLHSITLGRIGWEFDEYEEDGHRKFAKGDTKMRAGGSESFGYEPNLLCEFTRQQEVERKPGEARRKRVRYFANVMKDQTSTLNDEIFTFIGARGYKQGDYKRVYREFLPHLDFIERCSGVSMPAEDSRDLVRTESYWQKQDKERKALLEEWNAVMDALAAGRTKEAEFIRRILFETITGLRSWTRFESAELKTIERAVLDLMEVEELVKTDRYTLTADEQKLRKIALLAQANLNSVGDKKTITQIMLEESIARTA